VAERPPPTARDCPHRASGVPALVGGDVRAGRACLDQVDVGGVRAGQVDGAQPWEPAELSRSSSPDRPDFARSPALSIGQSEGALIFPSRTALFFRRRRSAYRRPLLIRLPLAGTRRPAVLLDGRSCAGGQPMTRTSSSSCISPSTRLTSLRAQELLPVPQSITCRPLLRRPLL
jgi:hypothetical protein